MSKTYIDGSSCKAINGTYGEFFNISFNLEKLQQYANKKGYVNMTMSKRKEPGQYGDTHYFTLNEWKPDASQGESAPKSGPNSDEGVSLEDIPF